MILLIPAKILNQVVMNGQWKENAEKIPTTCLRHAPKVAALANPCQEEIEDWKRRKKLAKFSASTNIPVANVASGQWRGSV